MSLESKVCEVCRAASSPDALYGVELVVSSTPMNSSAGVEEEWLVYVCRRCRSKLLDGWLFAAPAVDVGAT